MSAAGGRHDRARSGLAVVLAGALFAWVVHRNGGLDTVHSVISRLGERWLLLVPPTAVAALAILLTYRACLPRGGRDVPFLALLQVERAGNALNAVLPFGDSSSNLLKFALLRHWYTSDEIVAAGVWSSVGTGLTNVVAGLGPLAAAAAGVIPWSVGGPLAALCAVMTVPSITVLALVRAGLADRVSRLLLRLPSRFLAAREDRVRAWAKRLDRHLADATTRRKGEFLAMLGWKVGYQIVRVAQLFCVIVLLDLPGGLAAAVTYNAMGRAIQQGLPFVPGRLGVTEGLTASLFSAVGWPPEEGLALALTLRFVFFVNLAFSATALSGSDAIRAKYPARSREELRAARSTGAADDDGAAA